MKISIDGPSTVNIVPESEDEKKNLDVLWKALIRCDEDSKTLVPVGEYIPSKSHGAQFAIQ